MKCRYWLLSFLVLAACTNNEALKQAKWDTTTTVEAFLNRLASTSGSISYYTPDISVANQNFKYLGAIIKRDSATVDYLFLIDTISMTTKDLKIKFNGDEVTFNMFNLPDNDEYFEWAINGL
jgi:hypothetical protein